MQFNTSFGEKIPTQSIFLVQTWEFSSNKARKVDTVHGRKNRKGREIEEDMKGREI